MLPYYTPVSCFKYDVQAVDSHTNWSFIEAEEAGDALTRDLSSDRVSDVRRCSQVLVKANLDGQRFYRCSLYAEWHPCFRC